MKYRVEFQFTYGGSYFSESFEDPRDANNLVIDIGMSGDRVRLLGVERSDDGESWEPFKGELERV